MLLLLLLSATTRLLLAALLGAASAQYVAVVPPTLGGYGVPEYAAGGYYAAAVDPGLGAGLFPYPAAAYPQYAGPPPPPPPPPPGPSAALPHQPYPYLLPPHLPIVYQPSSAGPLLPDGATQQVVIPVFAEQEEVDEDPVAAEEAEDEQQVAHRSAVLRRTADYEDEEEEERVEEEEEQQQAAQDEDEEAELEMSQPVLVAGDEAVVAEVPLVGVTETASGEKEASGYYVANDDGVEATVVVYPGPAPDEPLPFTVLSSGQTAVLKQKRQSEGRTEESDDAKPDSAADTAEVTAVNSSSTAAVAGTSAAGDAAGGDREEASSASDGASSAVDYACLGKNGLLCKPGYACVCERRADGGEAEQAVGNRRSPLIRNGPHPPSRKLTCLLVVDGRVFLNPQCRPPMPPRRRLLPLPTPQPATASASTSPRAGLDSHRRGTTSSSG